MPQRRLDLRTRTVIDPYTGHHRLRAWIASYEDIEPEIFVYQRYPALPGETNPDDHFVNVASAADMKDYPKTEPVGGAPFFRLSYIDIVFRSVDLMNRSLDLIKEDIEALIGNLDRLDRQVRTRDFVFVGSSLSSSSSSSSTSSSSSSSSSLSSSSSSSSSSTM